MTTNGLRRLRRTAIDAKQIVKQDGATFGFVWRKSHVHGSAAFDDTLKFKYEMFEISSKGL